MTFPIRENTGLCPLIVASLKSIPIDSFSYKYYRLRHPGAIYNLMTSKLIDTIVLLCQELRENKTENINSFFRLLLNDFFKFYESCYEIMLAFCKESSLPKDNEIIHKWLSNQKYDAGKIFYEETRASIEGLKFYHNEIKHSSNDIQFIIFNNLREITAGYFLDLPIGTYTFPLNPISLNRELRHVQYLIYFISDRLNEVLKLHLKKTHSFDLLPSTEQTKNENFEKLNESIGSLSEFFLLNEIGEEVYHSSVQNTYMTFSKRKIAENLIDDYYGDGINLQMSVTHDGYTNSYLVPQCGLQQFGLEFYYKLLNGTLRKLKIINNL